MTAPDPIACVSAHLELAHPVINASGTFDAVEMRLRLATALDPFPFAAYVPKTVTLEPRG